MHLAPSLQQQQQDQTLNELKRLHKEKERALLKTIADQKKKMAKIEYEQKDNIRVKRIKQLEQELTQQELVLSIFEKNMSTAQNNEARRQVLEKLNDPPRTRPTRTELEFKIKELNALIKTLKSKQLARAPQVSQPVMSVLEDQEHSTTLGGVVVAQRAQQVASNLRVQDLEHTVMKLNGMLEQLQIEVAEKDEIVDRAHAEVERLKEENRRMVQLEADCEKKATQCSQQEMLIVKLKQQLEQNVIGQQGMDNLKEIYSTRLRHLSEQKKELELRLREKGLEEADRQKTIRSLKEELAQNEEQHGTRVQQLEQEIRRLEGVVDELQQRAKEQEGRDHEQSTEVQQLKEENQKLREEIERLRQEMEMMETWIEERKQKEHEKRQEISPVKRKTVANIQGIEEDSARTSQVSMLSEAFTDLQEVRFELAEEIDQIQ